MSQTPPSLSPEQKKQQSNKRKSLLSSSPTPPLNNHSNLFLSSALLGLPDPPHPNGVIQSSSQDAPLALITKPRRSPQHDSTSASMPVNLSTGVGRSPAAPPAGLPSQPPATSPLHTASRKSKTPKGRGQVARPGPGPALATWKGLSQNHLVQSLVDLFRTGESGIGIPGVSIPGVGLPGTCNPPAGLPANKESDDSADDDDEEEEDDDDEEDTDDTLSGPEPSDGRSVVSGY